MKLWRVSLAPAFTVCILACASTQQGVERASSSPHLYHVLCPSSHILENVGELRLSRFAGRLTLRDSSPIVCPGTCRVTLKSLAGEELSSSVLHDEGRFELDTEPGSYLFETCAPGYASLVGVVHISPDYDDAPVTLKTGFD